MSAFPRISDHPAVFHSVLLAEMERPDLQHHFPLSDIKIHWLKVKLHQFSTKMVPFLWGSPGWLFIKGLTLIQGKLSKVWMIFAHQSILKNVVYFLKIELCFHIWSATDNGLLDLRNSSRKLYHSPSDFEMVIPPYTTSLWGPQRPFIFYRIKKSTSKMFCTF